MGVLRSSASLIVKILPMLFYFSFLTQVMFPVLQEVGKNMKTQSWELLGMGPFECTIMKKRNYSLLTFLAI
uniref:Uncharacterized protein n=1 Tax=Arundo donax TaxID=35708 RepID=A0A0A9C754_ARUDO